MPTTESSPFNSTALVTSIERKIYLIRGQKVMLDSDLAELYGVSTAQFNQAVKRNRKRFPADFMFQLNKSEAESLRSQFVMSKKDAGEDLSRQVATVIRKLAAHEKYFVVVFKELNKLTQPTKAPTRRIGFMPDKKQGGNNE
jgi:hypothetical protein